ncbi:CesT family type III secretion system chaperone [Microbulbifer variabilis]|uniref:CesT family type III secretion system chaperone n=1 Tax=Microbulbifer variabilis TaxID=266805 RepID=UPI001CFED502|nr:CesT family type III secretion system chaperone [Microbulbifer variabilis]
MRNIFDDYIRELGRRIGIYDLALDENSRCGLATPQGMLITVTVDQDSDSVIFEVDIMSLDSPGAARENHLLKICMWNYVNFSPGHPVLLVNGITEVVNLVGMFDFSRADYSNFEAELSRYIDLAENCRSELLLADSMANSSLQQDDYALIDSGLLLKA